MRPALCLAALALPLAACNGTDNPEEAMDTSYEEGAVSPLPPEGEGDAPITDQTSIEGGPDEQADAVQSGDNMLPENASETDDGATPKDPGLE